MAGFLPNGFSLQSLPRSYLDGHFHRFKQLTEHRPSYSATPSHWPESRSPFVSAQGSSIHFAERSTINSPHRVGALHGHGTCPVASTCPRDPVAGRSHVGLEIDQTVWSQPMSRIHSMQGNPALTQLLTRQQPAQGKDIGASPGTAVQSLVQGGPSLSGAGNQASGQIYGTDLTAQAFSQIQAAAKGHHHHHSHGSTAAASIATATTATTALAPVSATTGTTLNATA
jgi:hypothetical protein